MTILFPELLFNVLGVKFVVELILQDLAGSSRHDRTVFARVDVMRIGFAALLNTKCRSFFDTILLLNAHATPVAAFSWCRSQDIL
jgi:hypothetical protein